MQLMSALGALYSVHATTAYFELGEVRGDPLGPSQVDLERWWEPVDNPAGVAALRRAGVELRARPPFSLYAHLGGALAWREIVAANRYWVDLPGFWQLVADARPRRRDDPLARFSARALAHLAPQTPARSVEVQRIVGLADARVRATKPRPTRSGRLAPVGPWLEALLGPAPAPFGQRTRRAAPHIPLCALGGPGSEEEP